MQRRRLLSVALAMVELVLLMAMLGRVVDRYKLGGRPGSSTVDSTHGSNSTDGAKNATRRDAQTATAKRNATSNTSKTTTHNATTATTAPTATPMQTIKSRPKRVITIITKLHGELANNLGYLLHAYAVKLELQERLPHVQFHIQGEHQDNIQKWTRAAAEIHKCFPSFASLKFESGKWDSTGEYAKRHAAMIAWLQEPNIPPGAGDWILKGNIWSSNTSANFQRVQFIQQLLNQQEQEPSKMFIQEPPNATISLPFLRAAQMQYDGALITKWHSRLVQVFHINHATCCNHLVEDNEVVFHFRNFKKEGPRLPGMGFVELHVSQVGHFVRDQINAYQIPTNKVAVISRFYNATAPVVSSLQKAGLQVRKIQPQSGPHDFCLLVRAKYIMGFMLSTFVRMAAVMGNATKVVLYLVDTPTTRQRWPTYFMVTQQRLWPNATLLQQRFHYVTLPEEFGRAS